MPTKEDNTEVILAQWEQPAESAEKLRRLSRPLFLIGAVCFIGILIALGIWRKDITYYLAAGVVVVGCFAFLGQYRDSLSHPPVILTNLRLQIGKRIFFLSELAGFWLQVENGVVAINVEAKKPTALPIVFLFPTNDEQEARETMLQALPELEPRHPTISDRINQYIRF